MLIQYLLSSAAESFGDKVIPWLDAAVNAKGDVGLIGAGVTALFFATMCLSPLLSATAQLWLLGIGTVGFDLGGQTTLIAHQTIVYGINPGARSRLNAVLFVSMFIGMAAGAALGSTLLDQWGWSAVTGMATISALTALAVRFWPAPEDEIPR